jgi:hypothetical protein
MDPMTQRVIEDGVWLLVLMVLIGFFWFHERGKRRTDRVKRQ